jgi:hypothetical protein
MSWDWMRVLNARGPYDECGICGRLVRWTAVTAAACPMRPWPGPRSLGCRRFPLPSGQVPGPPASMEEAGAAAPGISGACIASARCAATSGASFFPVISSAIFVLPFHDETKCYQRKALRGLFATVGVAGCSLAAGVRLPENECSHGTTIGKQRAPVNPRKPRPKETANARNDGGPVRPGGTLSEDRPKAVGGVTICGCERGERDWRGHIREKIR